MCDGSTSLFLFDIFYLFFNRTNAQLVAFILLLLLLLFYLLLLTFCVRVRVVNRWTYRTLMSSLSLLIAGKFNFQQVRVKRDATGIATFRYAE